MGNKNYARRQFFKKLTQGSSQEKPNISATKDPLFERYARKQLGGRHYSEQIINPPVGPDANPTANRSGNVTSGLNAYTGSWGNAEAAHLLRRVGFGVKKGDLDVYTAMTMSGAVDALLTVPTVTPALPALPYSPPSAPSGTPLNYYNATYADSSGITLGADWTGTNLTFASTSNDGSVEYTRQTSLSAWSWGICINDGTIIREKMVNFWYHLIPVNFDDVRGMINNSSTANHQYMKLLRDNALGNYNTLIRAIAKTPAMLVYLSNQYSTANAPNENFGRELMELFMLGKVPTQNYTEDDIKAAAKVLSGWRVTSSFTGPFPFTVGFSYTYHNQTNKQFSSFFATPPSTGAINNQPMASGANEFDLFFNMLFAQQGVTIAKYICRRLYRFFVYYDIDTNVEANVIAPLATALINANWEIMPVMKMLLKSEHFYDLANRGVMIKSPLDMITGLIRSMAIETNVSTGTANQYTIWNSFQSKANAMEQAYGLVPNVSGWKAYYQEPTYYQNWINTNTIQQRESLLKTLAGNGYSSGGLTVKIDVFAAVQQFSNSIIRMPDTLIDALLSVLMPVDLDATYKTGANGLKQRALLNNQAADHYWTDVWDYYIAPPGTATATQVTNNKNVVKGRLNALINELLLLAEFQLM